jgi:hypothetical protein
MSESGTAGDLETTALAIIEPATGTSVPVLVAGAGERAALSEGLGILDSRVELRKLG